MRRDLPWGCYLIILVAGLLMFAGWISNIIQVVSLAQADNWTAMFIVKLVGILVAPVGSILGIYGWF